MVVKIGGRRMRMWRAVYNTLNVQRHLISRPTLRIFRARLGEAWAEAAAAIG
jgi:hypothetical protein